MSYKDYLITKWVSYRVLTIISSSSARKSGWWGCRAFRSYWTVESRTGHMHGAWGRSFISECSSWSPEFRALQLKVIVVPCRFFVCKVLLVRAWLPKYWKQILSWAHHFRWCLGNYTGRHVLYVIEIKVKLSLPQRVGIIHGHDYCQISSAGPLPAFGNTASFARSHGSHMFNRHKTVTVVA